MLLEVNAYWFPDDYDPEKEDTLKTQPKLSKGVLIVNSDHIVAFNPHDSGDTMIRLTNGDVFRISYKFDSFRETMMENQVAKDILASNEN